MKPEYTLIDYVRWMGGFTFEEKPFCDADALVLCDVIYFEIFDSGTSPGKTLRELIGAAPIHDPSIVKRLGGGLEEHPVFIQAVAESRRFGEIRVGSYSETLDHEQSIQFAAAAFTYNKLLNFISFRGTDDTIAGWKEDFMIAFTKTTAQDMALEFTKANLIEGSKNYIGGHSKGGNLALYAASMLPGELQDRVTHVYDLDGPGFCKEVFDLKALDQIQDRTTFIIPEFSIIGKLFEPDIHDKKIAASNETAIMQHELLSWGTTGQGVETVPDNDPQAKEMNLIIAEWVESVPQDERRVFVNELFDALAEDGAKTMTDLMSDGLDGFEKILFRVTGTSEVTKKAAAALPEQALFGNLLREFREKGFFKFMATNKVVQALLLIVLGLLMVFIPENVFEWITLFIFAGLTAAQIVITVRRLIENNWDFTAASERLQFCLILIVLTLCLFIKRATMMMGSVIFLIIAFMIALYSGLKARDSNNTLPIRVLSGAECITANIMAVVFLTVPEENIYVFSTAVGICLIASGLARIILQVVEYYRLSHTNGKRAAALK